MGKRKTKRRSSRRNKKGGMYNLSSMCIWYGENNDSKPKLNNKIKPPGLFVSYCSDKKIENFLGYQGSKNLKAISIDSHKKVVGSISAPQKLPSIMNKKSLEVYNGTQTGNYNIYVVRYEKNCDHGGERYELYKIENCKIGNESSQGTVKVTNPKWRNPMIFTDKGNGMLDIKWGKTTKENVHVNSFLLERLGGEDNYDSADTEGYDSADTEGYDEGYGGGKRKKKRRKRTKKKSRKKRKRTKKRRRRRK